jgi:2-keto-3-deoxy-L-rhamnonate aldolase RhmA
MNRLRQRLPTGESAAGLWLSADSIVAIELAGQAGFDWAILDLEHGHFDASLVLSAIRAADGSGLALVVRVPDHAPAAIGRYLDWGATGIMVPNVHSPVEAQGVVAAMEFAPRGRRGMSRSVRAARFGDGFSEAQPVCIVQIESQQAVENVDAIAAVPGVDALFLGHTDLSQELGCAGNRADPRIEAAEERLLHACGAHGKSAGMAVSPATAHDAAARGFSLLTLASDVALLRSGFRQALRTSSTSHELSSVSSCIGELP